MQQLSKLQIRAKVLSFISKLKSVDNLSSIILEDVIFEFKLIEDYISVAEIFLKEFSKLEEDECILVSYILKEIVDSEFIEQKVFEYLSRPELSDEIKYKYVQLLSVFNITNKMNEVPDYFDEPNKVIDIETKKLLERASFNPEAMLDFLDFIFAVKDEDKYILLESLVRDYNGNMLANIVYPLLYSDFDDKLKLKAIDVLSESKSSLAIKPFRYLLEVSSNEEIISACKLGLKKLKLAGASESNALEYFNATIKDYEIFDSYTTIPDGNGNQAFLISRVNSENKYLLSAIVTNDVYGVVDCFGFYNISQEELIKIIAKFYASEGKYKVDPSYIKTKINNAIDITIRNKKTFPYEFICWSQIISDIEPLTFSLDEYANTNCKIQILSKEQITELLVLDYTLRWFITPAENEILKNILESSSSMENFDVDYLNDELYSSLDKIFTVDAVSLWKQRIYNLIYLFRTNSLLKEADNFYTILEKDEYFKLFKTILLQRSTYSYFIALQDSLNEIKKTTNIFQRKQLSETKYSIEKIENIIKEINRSWLNG